MSWLLYTAAAVLLLSVAILLQRVILHRHQANPYAFAVIFQLLVALVMLPFVLAHGMSFRGFGAMWLPLVILTIGFGVGSIIYGRTLQHIDASVFSVLFATQAIWVMLVGVLMLHERLGAQQLVGTTLILLGVVFLAGGVRAFRHNADSTGLWLGLLTGLVYGISIAAAAYGARHTEILTWTWMSFVTAGIAAALIKPSKIPLCKNLIRGEILPLILVLSVLYAAGNLSMNYAFRDGPFSLVAPIRQTGIIVTALLAFAYLREERVHVHRKLIASAMCCLGVILLVQ